MPHYLFDTEIVRLAFVLGIVFSMALYEWRQLTTGSIVVPGYIAVFSLQPSIVVATLANAAMSYIVVHRLLPRVVTMSAQTKFFALILTSVAIQSLAHIFSGVMTSDAAGTSILMGAGYIIPALIAHDMARHGVIRTLSAVLGTSLATAICVMALVWLVPDFAIPRPAAENLQSTFLIDGIFVAMLLSAISVVALKKQHRLSAGGFVGPAYLSLILVHPAQLAFLAILAPLTYLTITRLLMPRMILFGRRKFAAVLLVGCLYSWGGTLLLEHGFGCHSLPFSSPSLSMVSVVLIGLLANDIDRVGWSGLMRGTVLAIVFTLTGTLLVLEMAQVQRLEVLLPLSVLTLLAGLVVFAPLLNATRIPLFARALIRAFPLQPTSATLTPAVLGRVRWKPALRVSTTICLVILAGIVFLPIAHEIPLVLGSQPAPVHLGGRHKPTIASSPANFAVSTPHTRPGMQAVGNSDLDPAELSSPNSFFINRSNHDLN